VEKTSRSQTKQAKKTQGVVHFLPESNGHTGRTTSILLIRSDVLKKKKIKKKKNTRVKGAKGGPPGDQRWGGTVQEAPKKGSGVQTKILS